MKQADKIENIASSDVSAENNPISEQGKIEKKIKDVGNFAVIVGVLRFIAMFVLLAMMFSGNEISSFISSKYYFSDISLNVIEGVIFIILGQRIKKEVNDKTKKYLKVIIAFTAVLTLLSLGMGGKPILTMFLLVYSINGLLKIKKIEVIKKQESKHLISGWRWLWVIIGSVILLTVGIILDVSNSGVLSEPKELSVDKSNTYSEVSGNMYRNTKYHFRIKFPEGWKIGVGDGAHIVQKATFENSTISIFVQQFDVEGFEGFSSIKDAGTSKEVIDTVIEGSSEKFSDVKIINYGETKIDNEPAYWVEYSASSQVLDFQLKMTNLVYFLAKGDIIYSISAGTATDEYSKIKPIFTQTVSTFVLENY